jgi:hypothetical protein
MLYAFAESLNCTLPELHDRADSLDFEGWLRYRSEYARREREAYARARARAG